MASIVRWNPARLNEKLLSAYRQSIYDARNLALSTSPARGKATAFLRQIGPTSAFLKTSGKLGHIFELGRQGGYVIQPGLKTTRGRVAGGSRFEKETTGVRAGSGNIALKFSKGDGGFARGGVIGGAMRARPYIRPAGVAWARGLYQRRAGAALRGFARI